VVEKQKPRGVRRFLKKIRVPASLKDARHPIEVGARFKNCTEAPVEVGMERKQKLLRD